MALIFNKNPSKFTSVKPASNFQSGSNEQIMSLLHISQPLMLKQLESKRGPFYNPLNSWILQALPASLSQSFAPEMRRAFLTVEGHGSKNRSRSSHKIQTIKHVPNPKSAQPLAYSVDKILKFGLALFHAQRYLAKNEKTSAPSMGNA